MSYEKQNFIDGQVLKAEHLNKMEEELAREKSWNELTDKPVVTVGEPDTLTNPFDIASWGVVPPDEACYKDGQYRISDRIPTIEDFANGATITLINPSTEEEMSIPITASEVVLLDNGVISIADSMLGVFPDGNEYGMPGGIYCAVSYQLLTLTIPGYTGFAKEQIDPAFLPEHLQFGDFETGGDTLTWDGNTVGLAYQSVAMAYKVSDAVPTKEDFANGCTFVLVTASGDTEHTLDAETVQAVFSDDGFAYMDAVAIVPYDGYVFGDNAVFSEKGTYLLRDDGAGVWVSSFTIPGYTRFPMVKSVEERYLPGAILLYTDGNNYLYATSDTSDTSKRLTKAELKSFVNSGRSIYHYYNGAHSAPTHIMLFDTHGVVRVLKTTTSVVEFKDYYTAEYTAT